MSCATINSGAVQLNVAVASLPEGFCPASMQELANAIGARLIISPSNNFNTFAIGSIPPASNVGPWLKDCNQWFVFDDATATYVPIALTTPGGFRTQEYRTASGVFVVPDFVFNLEVDIWGGGGGGGTDTGGIAAGGGGAGAFVKKILAVTPGQVIPYTIGAGGTFGAPAGAGGTSTFLTLVAGGGLGAVGGTNNTGARGGVATGGDMNVTGQSGLNGTSGFGGTGGSSPQGGGGGTASPTQDLLLITGKVPGGGGCGDYISAGSGNGAGGAVLIRY